MQITAKDLVGREWEYDSTQGKVKECDQQEQCALSQLSLKKSSVGIELIAMTSATAGSPIY